MIVALVKVRGGGGGVVERREISSTCLHGNGVGEYLAWNDASPGCAVGGTVVIRKRRRHGGVDGCGRDACFEFGEGE